MSSSVETWQIGEHAVEVSRLEKLSWPEPGFTKGEMLRYYQRIAPTMLPHLHDRPVTLRVFPEGAMGSPTISVRGQSMRRSGCAACRIAPRRADQPARRAR